MAEKSSVGERLEQAGGWRDQVVFADGDRFLYTVAYCVRCRADGACRVREGDLPGGAQEPGDFRSQSDKARVQDGSRLAQHFGCDAGVLGGDGS